MPEVAMCSRCGGIFDPATKCPYPHAMVDMRCKATGGHPEMRCTLNDGHWGAHQCGDYSWGDFPLSPEKPEAVAHPQHYGGVNDPYEHIKVVEAWGLGYNLGNCTKYICRAGKKHPTMDGTLEDLKKALFYLQREVSNVESAMQHGPPKSMDNQFTKDRFDYQRETEGRRVLRVLDEEQKKADSAPEVMRRDFASQQMGSWDMRTHNDLLDGLPEEQKIDPPRSRELLCAVGSCPHFHAPNSPFCAAHRDEHRRKD